MLLTEAPMLLASYGTFPSADKLVHSPHNPHVQKLGGCSLLDCRDVPYVLASLSAIRHISLSSSIAVLF